MKQVLDKQKMQSPDTLGGSSTSKLEILTKENNVLYVDFAKKQLAQLEQLNKTVSESFGDKGDLSSTLNTIQETITPAKGMGKTKSAPPGLVGAGKEWMKDLFTVRGFLDKTSILKRGHDETGIGRVADKYLEHRENSFKPKQEEVKPNDAQPPKNETADLMQEQIELLEIIAENAPLAVEKLQKSLEEQSVIRKVNEGRVKFNADTGRYHEQGKEARNKMVKEADVRTTSTKGSLDPSDEGRVRTFTRVKKAKEEAAPENTSAKIIKFPETQSSGLGSAEDPNSTKKRAKVVKVKEAANDASMKSSGLGSADLTEAEIERGKVEDHQTDLLQQIVDNTQSLKKPVGNKPEPPKDGMGLGIIGSILAGIVGSIVGLARAWVKTIKLFANALIPTELMEKIKKGFTAVDDFFSSIFSKFKSLFDFSGESKIGKIFGTIKEAMSSFIKPFVTAYEVIADLLKGPIKMVSGVFTVIKEYFTMFANTVGKVAGIVGKLMVPVLIIMTIWDTVKGAIEGFAEEGIIGGIKGAITGLFNSLIFGPIDMLKDAMAWVLGFFGFDKAKELLESFSLEDIFKKFINAVFAPIDLIKNLFSSIMGWFENLEIPGFEIGIGSFKKKFGPWYPFKKEEKAPESGGGDKKAEAVTPKDNAPKKVANQDMSKSSISPEEAKNILESGSKRDIESFGGVEKLKQIASGSDAAKLKPSAEPQTGNKVAAQSADSEMAKNAPASSSSTVIAPMSSVNNNSSSTYAIKPPVRNPNQGVQNQMQKRYGT